ncbi:MAG: hypothetical protein ACFFG0_03445 [Candidatus Thorarchaeota archaeon]
MRVEQITLVRNQTLAQSGSITGRKLTAREIGKSLSSISLFLQNTGLSTSLTVTYQIGFLPPDVTQSDSNINWLTPSDGGDIPDLTTVNITTDNYKHKSISLAPGEYYRFIITENGNNTANNVALYAQILMD